MGRLRADGENDVVCVLELSRASARGRVDSVQVIYHRNQEIETKAFGGWILESNRPNEPTKSTVNSKPKRNAFQMHDFSAVALSQYR